MSVTPPPARRAPAVFRLDDPQIAAEPDEVLDAVDPPAESAGGALEAIVNPPRRGIGWGRIALGAGGALASLALALVFDELVRDLFARADWLGWTGIALVALFAFAVLALLARELAGLLRLRRVAQLRLDAEAALSGTREEAVAVARELLALYSARPDTAAGRSRLKDHMREIIDARDLLALAERDLVAPLDARARGLVSGAARRVSVVTAVSPRALVDVVYVLWESLRLIRRLATLYGGRPGALGLVTLTRAVVGHLAVTGTMAVGDTLVGQIVGGGLAGRLSAKLGEGVVNGFMTARIGLAAMDVCRPLPFLATERPRLKDLTGDLVSVGSGRE